MEMRDSHRLFLQSFMSRGLLDAKEVKLLYKTCCQQFQENYPDNEEDRKFQLLEFVRTISQHVRPFYMDIRKGISEEDGVSYYCLVCTNESAITKLASDYTANELEYFKKLIESIVESDDGEIGSTAAINLTDRVPRVSKGDAQALLTRLEKAKWITMTRGHVSLSPRSLLELEQYILDMYQDNGVDKCNACKRLCIKGQSCDDCGTKLHFHCAARFFHGKEKPRCPKQECGVLWTHSVPSRETEPHQGTSSQTSGNRKRKTRT